MRPLLLLYLWLEPHIPMKKKRGGGRSYFFFSFLTSPRNNRTPQGACIRGRLRYSRLIRKP